MVGQPMAGIHLRQGSRSLFVRNVLTEGQNILDKCTMLPQAKSAFTGIKQLVCTSHVARVS